MRYDFDTPVERRGTDSLKWDVGEGELPMWVADMDFETAPEIREAIACRAAHGIYGYTNLPADWADAYADWWRDRHHYAMEKDSLIFVTGVVPAISSLVRKLTTPGERVLVQTPVYNIFFNSIVNSGRFPAECPLVYRDGQYDVDFAALEAALSDPQVSLMILCNPHNPVGRIWDAEQLSRIGALCKRYGVTVISDEIHCDLTDPGREYVPFASVSALCREISVTCLAPTKAFNLAGIQTAAVSVPEPHLRHKVWRALNTDEVAEPNVFAGIAAAAAFRHGGPWLDALRAYLCENKQFAARYLAENVPAVRWVRSEATYLMWLDVSALPDAANFARVLRGRTGLYLTGGAVYRGNGADFLRMNIACPRVRLEDGLERLKRGVESVL